MDSSPMEKTTAKKNITPTETLLEIGIKGIQEVKGKRIAVLDFRQTVNAIAKYFVICEGASNTQVGSIGRSIEVFTKREVDEKPWTMQGQRSGVWALLDYGDIVFHIFHKDHREHYALEDLWADVPRRDVEDVEDTNDLGQL
jgi:ribosome-associated protein